MLYNNLLFFLVAIFTFSTNSPPAEPRFSGAVSFVLVAGMMWALSLMAERLYRTTGTGAANRYFSIERKLTGVAVACFVLLVYGLDIKFFLQPLSFAGKLPALENLAGLGIFFILLGIIWLRARSRYELLFHRPYSPFGFVLYNIKINLPIVLPWLILSFAFDLLTLLPFKGMHKLLVSPWGDLLLFGVFVCFLILFFPPLVRRLWNCRPMSEGPLLARIRSFCEAHGFHSEILYWPLFEGQILTAGVMGIVPGFRYLLLTPALLQTLSQDELESVLAHEIGHVKKKHLLLYVTLLLGFSVVAGALATPIPHMILASDAFYWMLDRFEMPAETLLGVLGTIPLLVLLLVYFRFVFGFFIRNFERQADAFVFRAQDSSRALISSFEKIARLSGESPKKKNWHHFGIGERIAFLEQCEHDRTLVRRQDRKVYSWLFIYFLCVVLLVVAVRRVDLQQLSSGYEVRYAKSVLMQKARQDPGNSLWPLLLGDFLQSKQMERKAIAAYERALELEPTSAEVNNNLAWILLTAKDRSLRDPLRALNLARTAVLIREEGFVLDTLAVAFWANGLVEEALVTEAKAVKLDPSNRQFYLGQMKKFKTTVWGEDDEGSDE